MAQKRKRIMSRVEKPTKPRKIATPAKRSTNGTVQEAIKVIKAKGGSVHFEQRVPVIVAMDKNADIDFFKVLASLPVSEASFFTARRSQSPPALSAISVL